MTAAINDVIDSLVFRHGGHTVSPQLSIFDNWSGDKVFRNDMLYT